VTLPADTPWVLVVNAGSSSVKLAVVDPVSGRRAVTGLAERLGSDDAVAHLSRGEQRRTDPLPGGSHTEAVAHLLGLMSEEERAALGAVGHRVVHGGSEYVGSVILDDSVVARLEELVPLAPMHLPGGLAGIAAARELLPDLPQAAVFDTAFHSTMPPRAYRYAVPREWYSELGVRRYGFHGTSHRYVSAKAAEMLGRPAEGLRLVTLHLGNGCSAAAVRDGRSVDTTMGFTPLEGLVMGTRSGDVDPGLLAFLAARLGTDAAGVVDALNTRSGLLGMSGSSNDMRTLLEAAAAGDDDAALAVEVFCYRAAKSVAALAVPLGRLDAVVFTGGIGEHAAPVRAAIVAYLEVLGLRIDVDANEEHGRTTGGRITADGPVIAMVVPTDEELLIARDAADLA
jgi:acetate kinase